jgi:hypothetical protein
MNAVDILLRLAAWLMSRGREDWLAAMRAETAHLPPRAALSWASGCVVSALKERVMLRTGTFEVSRAVFAIEMLCFVPLTIGWWDAIAGNSGILHLNADIASRSFLDTAQGTFILAMMIASATLGIVGPIGLWLAGRHVVTGRGLRSRPGGAAMIGALLATGAAWIMARAVWGEGAYAASLTSLLLLVILPAAVIAHLMAVAPRRETGGNVAV